MTSYLRNIIVFALAGFFLFAGSGMNIVNYCCDVCAEHGIEEVAENSCSALHHHESDCCESSAAHVDNSHEDMACSNTSHHPNGCHVLRLNVETPTIVVDNQFKTNFTGIQLFISTAFLLVNFSTDNGANQFIAHSPPNFSLPSGREILSNKSVLII